MDPDCVYDFGDVEGSENESKEETSQSNGDEEGITPVLFLCMTRMKLQDDLKVGDVLLPVGDVLFKNTQHQRDITRILSAVENSFDNVTVHTLLLQDGCSEKHINCDIIKCGMAQLVADKFCDVMEVGGFEQIVLDYYWLPSGWTDTRWTKSFFGVNLAEILMLLRNDSSVYLPFSLNCFIGVTMHWRQLREVYGVRAIVRCGKKGTNMLWAGTNIIPTSQMLSVLGKDNKYQEEEYLGISPTPQPSSTHPSLRSTMMQNKSGHMCILFCSSTCNTKNCGFQFLLSSSAVLIKLFYCGGYHNTTLCFKIKQVRLLLSSFCHRTSLSKGFLI